MKKEIMDLVNFKSNEKEEHKELYLNDYFYLYRYTKDALQQDVDKLYLYCDLMPFYESREIKARKYEDIIEEIREDIDLIMIAIGKKLGCDIISGRLTGKNPFIK